MSAAPEVFFMRAHGSMKGQRLYLHHAPRGIECQGAVLYVHPFAEEMNKSRRMAALQSRALAQSGYAVLQIDLLGCGDSSGDFGDATWADWVADVVQAANWLQQRYAAGALWLWGLRAGCLLAAEAARRLDSPSNLLFWHPAVAGRVLLQQFLRLKAAGDMLDGKAAGTTAALRAQLAAGEAIEVAGYRLNPALARGLEQATLAPSTAGQVVEARRGIWLELSTREGTPASPAIAAAAQEWNRAGHDVTVATVTGPAFWQTSEIEEAPALIDATLALLAATVEA